MAAGSTVLRLDLLIFSTRPAVNRPPPGDGDPGAGLVAGDLAGLEPVAGLVPEGEMRDHALREQAGERLGEIEIAALAPWPGCRSAHRAGAGPRARRRRYTGRPAASSRPRRARTAGPRHWHRRSARSTRSSPRRCRRCRSRAAPAAPQRGQSTTGQVGWRSSGLPGREKSTSSGSSTGNCSRGTGTTPQAAQWITGIGQPQ